MSGELEAAGAAVTAGLVAGAIEGRESNAQGDGACLNCAAALTGPYCSQCGQSAHAHRTLLHLVEEVMHGLIHFDTKAWRTLPMLAFRPGTLTRNYIYGKRARYISPLALFLFTIFLMFFVFAFTDANVLNVNVNAERPVTAAELAETRVELEEARAGLEQARAEIGIEGEGGPAQRILELSEAEVARREAELAQAATSAEAVQSPATEGEEATWQDQVREAAKSGEISVNTGFAALDARILHSLENPDLALYKVQQAAYKFSFLLVPLSLPFVWLLFLWKRGVTLYDHAVFVLYSLSFASLLFVVISLLNTAPVLEVVGGALFTFGMPSHMFFHLKGAYALSWWSAIWRSVLLMLSALLALSLFFVSIILLGLGG